MKHVLLCLLIMALSRDVNAQSNFWNSPQAYLGQTPPGDVRLSLRRK